MKKLFIFVLLVIGVGVLYYFFSLSKPVVNTQQTSNAITVAPLVSEYASTTYTEIKLSYPKSSATELPEIFNYVTATKADFIKNYANPSAQDVIDLDLRNNGPYQLYMDTRLATSSKTVSYILETYEFTGGAHGGTTINTFTYDLSTGKLVTIENVFTPSYLSVVAPMAKTYFTSSLGDNSQPSMIEDGTSATTTNYSSWYLTDKTVVFIFGQYQVGPYVIGIQEFPIEKSSIQNILQAEYK